MDARVTLYICMALPQAVCCGNSKRASPCGTVTLVDGLALVRAAFHHFMNYRSVVAFGTAQNVEEPLQKTDPLRIISEHLIAG
jgi:nitroimidazol reductase NimA-like FMN-containing flavoprotein (pyridoxamine 5'-phosphate oxidase superfamily)